MTHENYVAFKFQCPKLYYWNIVTLIHLPTVHDDKGSGK
jgi:hypothetical protein